jgi:hypothetical protein
MAMTEEILKHYQEKIAALEEEIKTLKKVTPSYLAIEGDLAMCRHLEKLARRDLGWAVCRVSGCYSNNPLPTSPNAPFDEWACEAHGGSREYS